LEMGYIDKNQKGIVRFHKRMTYRWQSALGSGVGMIKR